MFCLVLRRACVAPAWIIALVTLISTQAHSQGQSQQAVSITALTPASIASGSASRTLVVKGAGFTNGSQVRVDGHQRPTTYTSATELRAQLEAGDLLNPKALSVTVFTPTRGSTGALTLTVVGVVAAPPPAVAPPAPAPAPPPPVVAVATSVQSISATAQAGSVRANVQIPPGVIVRDQTGSPMPGVTVNFIVTSGGGAVTPSSRITATDGTARVESWTLGSASGANSVVAKVTGLQAVTFTATAAALPVSTPSRIDAVTSLSQEAAAGGSVPNPPAVRVLDQNSNPMAGVSVSLAVVSGGGTIDPQTRVTDANGVVRANSWVLGTAAGANSVRAAVAGSSTGTVPSVLFSATGISVPRTVQAASAVTQNGFTGSAAPQPPAVVVRDQSGNPIAGVSVSFTASAAGGSVSPATKVTGADGVARATTWTLGSTVGTNTVAARVNGLATNVIFTATVLQASATAGISISPPPPPTSVQPGADPTFTAAVPPARLTEEILDWHGESTEFVAASTLDCDQFGAKYVMVAIAGKMGEAIDLIRIACSEYVGGVLSDDRKWTSSVGGSGSVAADFVRSCPDDYAIVGIEGTIKYTQLRGMIIRCRKITAGALTSGTISRQPLAGGAGTAWPPDDCTQGRPARAIRVGENGFSVTGTLLERYNPIRVIVAAELHCEQPILP